MLAERVEKQKHTPNGCAISQILIMYEKFIASECVEDS